MKNVKIYMDMCCYNRFYDDQSQERIRNELFYITQIKRGISTGRYSLVTSFMLEFENSRNPYSERRNSIGEYLKTNSAYHVGFDRVLEAEKLSEGIIHSGIKEADAMHIASAILGECEYFITTDDRILKFRSSKIQILLPNQFIKIKREVKH